MEQNLKEFTIPKGYPFEGKSLDILISEKEIKDRIAELAVDISERFKTEKPIFIGVLNGSFLFYADLLRELSIDFEVDFLKIDSYGSATKSTGTVRLLKDISANITGRHVVIIEDIIDTGLSIQFLKQRMENAGPASVTFVTLLFKPDVAKLNFPIDYIGFNIPNRFVVGYGLDYDQKLRGLKNILAFREGDV
ncbi:MAG: hypoxanthine phosphoribosyltransferase [Candidatus Marinimicrobia bacterium]|jgi:hypoxanthine phosphoribosyltransferase|nr:hypoxanthine phosphoribosyltransferase [Candidatus Neomarinimicrobiota bacterium]MBT3633356.1 hypoxanthine phosphoribosyltransferase [Candidatus Neomarinimicrobiota bacterium]MBT3681499.1 hypoxanthine phosphoribosyltransferase [Candidatus Neomarinimicrobiota bacterium]MBT3758534.1 hypoxanthine phosphoribosyltransferase [Candidatus Neomarinimicrobiota bacterium]MBT3894812.1 hypoxanthine phosphoribosyltransferase [Candidatus Neomarinimicrobiota bacterium]